MESKILVNVGVQMLCWLHVRAGSARHSTWVCLSVFFPVGTQAEEIYLRDFPFGVRKDTDSYKAHFLWFSSALPILRNCRKITDASWLVYFSDYAYQKASKKYPAQVASVIFLQFLRRQNMKTWSIKSPGSLLSCMNRTIICLREIY